MDYTDIPCFDNDIWCPANSPYLREIAEFDKLLLKDIRERKLCEDVGAIDKAYIERLKDEIESISGNFDIAYGAGVLKNRNRLIILNYWGIIIMNMKKKVLAIMTSLTLLMTGCGLVGEAIGSKAIGERHIV